MTAHFQAIRGSHQLRVFAGRRAMPDRRGQEERLHVLQEAKVLEVRHEEGDFERPGEATISFSLIIDNP